MRSRLKTWLRDEGPDLLTALVALVSLIWVFNYPNEAMQTAQSVMSYFDWF